MPLVATTVWEVRSTGSINNGSGFNDRIPGTSVDYSQQNASQLSINDLAGNLGSVTVTSVAAGFTNAMVGNVMRIRGGVNFTVGFYEIVQFITANNVNLDRVPVTVGAGANGLAEVGGAQINVDLIATSVVVPGNTVWIKAGTYPAHPSSNFNPVTTIYLPLRIIGYNAARGDNPTGNNRPLLEMALNAVISVTPPSGAPNTKMRNIRIQSFSGTSLLNIANNGSSTFLENCKLESSSISTIVLFTGCIGGHNCIMDCEFSNPGGGAASVGVQAGSQTTVINSYFHDLGYGIQNTSGRGQFCLFNIFSNIRTAGILCSTIAFKVINCTFANMPRGFYQTTATDCSFLFMNNTFTDCTIAAIEAVGAKIMNNNFFSNAANVIGSAYGIEDNNMFVDPQFVTPGSVFALQRTSGLIDKAFSMRLGV